MLLDAWEETWLTSFKCWDETSWRTPWDWALLLGQPKHPSRWTPPDCANTFHWWLRDSSEVASAKFHHLQQAFIVACELWTTNKQSFSHSTCSNTNSTFQSLPAKYSALPFLMCLLSEAKVCKKVLAWTTRNCRWYSGLRMASVLNVSVTYLWK